MVVKEREKIKKIEEKTEGWSKAEQFSRKIKKEEESGRRTDSYVEAAGRRLYL